MTRMRGILGGWRAALCAALLMAATPALVRAWSEDDFDNRPVNAYPIPMGRDNVIGSLGLYTIRKGDTLLDVGRWYGVTATEIADANNHIDWWTPPVGRTILLPGEHVLPDGPRVGVVMNIPEMRLYYYYPSPVYPPRKKGVIHTAYSARGAQPTTVYSFPVGLGRFDWKTPVGTFEVRGKTRNPTWVVPEDIYREHLERDGEAEHVVSGSDPDNPLGLYRIELTLPEYALHGTNDPWGVGMEVSHGCVRLYPEDIEWLFNRVRIGTPGRFVYQPVKFGWRGNWLYVEVHPDLYGRYPGLWNYAIDEARRRGVIDQVDTTKLERAVEEKTGVPTFVMPGPDPTAPPTPVTPPES